MKIAKTVAVARRVRRESKKGLFVLVPTMGALHRGHAMLMRRARKLAGKEGSVAVSIFVNPTQFGPEEDFSKYPRPWEADVKLCKEEGVDVVFAPSPEEMYAGAPSVFVDEGELSQVLCGRSRPGHFRGVCTVVTKLFTILQPDVAVFGEKDWQQLAILRRMTRDLNLPVRLVGQATVRESDGLAVSSRNGYLTGEERGVAPGIHAALRAAAGERTVKAVLRTGRRLLEKIPGARVDYLELVDAETLRSVEQMDRPMRLAAAVFLGRARLIDNIGVPVRR